MAYFYRLTAMSSISGHVESHITVQRYLWTSQVPVTGYTSDLTYYPCYRGYLCLPHTFLVLLLRHGWVQCFFLPEAKLQRQQHPNPLSASPLQFVTRLRDYWLPIISWLPALLLVLSVLIFDVLQPSPRRGPCRSFLAL